MDDYEMLISTTDVELLKIAWRNDKAAPEILRFESDLIQRAMEQIRLVEENLEISAKDGIDPLILSMYQMDLDRTQFLLRSYLRIRLQKIEKYMFHILKTELWNWLSQQEKEFARRCTDDMEKHLEESVMSKLPENYRSILKQSITSEEDDMVPEPPVDTFVVCRSKGFVGPIHLEDSNEPLFMEQGDLCFIRFEQIKPFLEKGEINLV